MDNPLTTTLEVGQVFDLPVNGGGSVTVRVEAPSVDAIQNELFLITNDVSPAPAIVEAFSASQLAQDYDGPPNLQIRFGEGLGTGHSLALLNTGTLIAATAEGDDPDNGWESWWIIEPQYVSSGVPSAPPVKRLTVNRMANWSPPNYGARCACQLPDGSVALYRVSLALVGAGIIHGVPGIAQVPVVTPDQGVNGWDIHVDPNGSRLWMLGGDILCSVPIAGMSTSGPIAVDKIAQGSNVSGNSDQDSGAASMNFDSSGNLYVWDYWDQVCRVFDAATIAALTAVPSNPAPAREFSIPDFAEIWGSSMGVDGSMWFATYTDPGRLVRLSPAQVAGSGPQTPDRAVVCSAWPLALRHGFGWGMWLR